MRPDVTIESVKARAFKIPTDRPEADGTIAWDSTTLVVVEVSGGGEIGIGYTYSSAAIAGLIGGKLAKTVEGCDAFAPEGAWLAMQRAVRNLGREGLAATAISAVDTALYDLKARLLDLPLVRLLGSYRSSVPIYGSGGFTTYSDRELQQQLGGWVGDQGCAFVKMKVGSEPDRDPHRVEVAREAIGNRAMLFVDANGAYTRKQALGLADQFAAQGVGWFEEPVSSDDLTGLKAIRRRAPQPMEVAAGEYAYTTDYVRTMLQAEAVDVQQADVTRCGGITGFLRVAEVAAESGLDVSGHCAPQVSAHACAAIPNLRHLEWFHDHVRLERMLFDGVLDPENGVLVPDRSRPGHGLELKRAEADRHAA